jgi:hypothetical protein
MVNSKLVEILKIQLRFKMLCVSYFLLGAIYIAAVVSR